MAPSARAAKIGVACATPRATAALRRRIRSCDFGPGIGVRRLIVGMSVPSDRLFVQIDMHLLRLEIFLDAPGPELAAEPGLLVAAPRSLDIRWLHVIHPHNSGAQRFHYSKRFKNVA